MKVRTQLVLAFLLLAVVPLAGIVLYSYASSLAAFKDAIEAESSVLAEEMARRLDAVRGDIDTRLAGLTDLPVRSLMEGESSDLELADLYLDLMGRMGEVAPLIDWLEFSPTVGEPGAESYFFYPSKALERSLRKLQDLRENLDASGLSAEYFERLVSEVVREQSAGQLPGREALAARGQEMKELLGREFMSPVRQGARVVGELKAMVPPAAILRQVLSGAPRDQGKVPFARDGEGGLYVDDPRDRAALREIGITEGMTGTPAEVASDDWIVIETADADSGLTFGVARPIGSALRGIRGAAARNFSYGLGMIVLATLAVAALSSRMTRSLKVLSVGAERLAQGDLTTRLPLDSRDEFGQLARTLNRMASQLSDNQVRLLEEERRRKDQELQQRLLQAEHQRKTRELEEARRFQLSLLPKSLPRHPSVEVAVSMRTATEVGGDYYDFFPGPDGTLTAAVGDAAGHGARAGTMVTVVKGLFTAGAGRGEPEVVLAGAARAIKRMNLERMTMGVVLVRISGREITASAAGMPPLFVYRRASGEVEEVALPGVPLGGLADSTYHRWTGVLDPGDTVLAMTDGFPELLGAGGEPFGYTRVRRAFGEVASAGPEEIVARLNDAADRWRGGGPLGDDMTFAVLKAVTVRSS